MGHRFTYVVSPEEERENLTVEWFLRRHGYSRHIITGLKRTQIRSYVFDDRRVKDHRTNFQTSDVNGVMDGKIDGFVKAYLMEFAGGDNI